MKIYLIEASRDGNKPTADFMPAWLQTRSDIVAFISSIRLELVRIR